MCVQRNEQSSITRGYLSLVCLLQQIVMDNPSPWTEGENGPIKKFREEYIQKCGNTYLTLGCRIVDTVGGL